MLRVLGKLVAAWLTAFAIAGVTVWAGPEEDGSGPEAAAAKHRADAVPSPSAERPDVAD